MVEVEDAGRSVRGSRRRGRRPAGEDTRAALLAAARVEFAERGYDSATVRRIAERAGVDAAMVNHWFGGKEALFTASLDIPIDPAVVFGTRSCPATRSSSRSAAPHVPHGLGRRRRRSAGRADPQRRQPRGRGPDDARVHLAGDPRPGCRVVAPDRAELRAALAASQIIGLAMVRYVVRLEPLASADHDTVIAAMAPNLQRYFTGALD